MPFRTSYTLAKPRRPFTSSPYPSEPGMTTRSTAEAAMPPFAVPSHRKHFTESANDEASRFCITTNVPHQQQPCPVAEALGEKHRSGDRFTGVFSRAPPTGCPDPVYDEVGQMEKGLPGDDFARFQPTPQVTQTDDSRQSRRRQVARHHLATPAWYCTDFRAVKGQRWRQRPEGRCEGPALETTS